MAEGLGDRGRGGHGKGGRGHGQLGWRGAGDSEATYEEGKHPNVGCSGCGEARARAAAIPCGGSTGGWRACAISGGLKVVAVVVVVDV